MLKELSMDKDGNLLDAEGKPFKVGEDTIKVTNALTQATFDAAVIERVKGKERQIAELKAQVEKAPELQGTINTLQTELAELKTQAENAQRKAQDDVATTLSVLQKKVEAAETLLATERAAHLQTQLTNTILSFAGDKFINTLKDVVPEMLKGHKREPVAGSDGKPVKGEFKDTFKVSVAAEDGSEKEEDLPLDKALAAFAENKKNSHYVKGAQSGGSGGSSYVNFANLQRGKMTDAEKTDFISKQGHAAYLKLPV